MGQVLPLDLPSSPQVAVIDHAMLLTRYPTGALATMGACLFSNPMEVMKTRLQLQVARLRAARLPPFPPTLALSQGELKGAATYQKAYRNVFHALTSVYRAEGIRYCPARTLASPIAARSSA